MILLFEPLSVLRIALDWRLDYLLFVDSVRQYFMQRFNKLSDLLWRQLNGDRHQLAEVHRLTAAISDNRRGGLCQCPLGKINVAGNRLALAVAADISGRLVADQPSSPKELLDYKFWRQ